MSGTSARATKPDSMRSLFFGSFVSLSSGRLMLSALATRKDLRVAVLHKFDRKASDRIVSDRAPSARDAVGAFDYKLDIEHFADVAETRRDGKCRTFIAFGEYLCAPLDGKRSEIALGQRTHIFLPVGTRHLQVPNRARIAVDGLPCAPSSGAIRKSDT